MMKTMMDDDRDQCNNRGQDNVEMIASLFPHDPSHRAPQAASLFRPRYTLVSDNNGQYRGV